MRYKDKGWLVTRFLLRCVERVNVVFRLILSMEALNSYRSQITEKIKTSYWTSSLLPVWNSDEVSSFLFFPLSYYLCSPTVSSLTMPCTFLVQFTSNFCLLRSVQWEVKFSRFFADKTKVVTFVVLLAYLHF